MYWQEKIDRLKKRFPQSEFRDPFTDWSDILRKIESKFVKKHDSSYHLTNWADNLKNKIPIRTISKHNVADEIKKLNPNHNYWIVIVAGDNPTARHHVYDCTPSSLEAILSIAPRDFYIIDKKYEWLTYFEVDETTNEVSLIKGSTLQTPFDD